VGNEINNEFGKEEEAFYRKEEYTRIGMRIKSVEV